MTNSERLGQIGSAALLLAAGGLGLFVAASHPLCWRDLSASLPASLRQPQPHPITSPPHLDRFHVRPAPTFLSLPALQKEARERVHLHLPPRPTTIRCCGGHGLLPLNSGQAGRFGLLRLGLLGSELGASLYHSPRGKGCKEHLASPSPLALHPWPCRLPAAWESPGGGLCSLAQFSTSLFPKEVLGKSAQACCGRLPERHMGGGRLRLRGDSS